MPSLLSGESNGALREHLLDVEALSGQEPKIRVRDLTRVSDDGSLILKGVSMDIPKGMIVGVIGPSGSGKSTFLRSLNRLWEPPATTVFLDGVDIASIDVIALRRRVGMLFQLPVLFEGTTIIKKSCLLSSSIDLEKLSHCEQVRVLRFFEGYYIEFGTNVWFLIWYVWFGLVWFHRDCCCNCFFFFFF